MIEILKITATYNPFWFRMQTSEGLLLIHLDDLNKHKFAKGSQINTETYNSLYLAYLTRKTKEKILRRLAIKQKSTKEIKQAIKEILYKLSKEKDAPKDQTITSEETEEIQSNIITYLEENNYLNDYKYGENLLTKYLSSNKPKGMRFIKSTLSAKGIAEADITSLIDGLGQNTTETELKNALILMEKLSKRHKYKTADQNKRKTMALRYLTSQGYGFDISLQALKEYL